MVRDGMELVYLMGVISILSISRFWLVGLVGKKMAVAISNSFYVVFLPNFSPHTKFHSNHMKNAEVEIFRYWSVLVGRFWLVCFGWYVLVGRFW